MMADNWGYSIEKAQKEIGYNPQVDLSIGSFPFWIYLVYLWERLPNFPFFKTLYSHINYVIGQKQDC